MSSGNWHIPCHTIWKIPQDKRKETTYTPVVYEVLPQKENLNKNQIKIIGNHIFHPRDTGTDTASLEILKLLLNRFLSQKGANIGSFDVKIFYLGTPMDRPEYIRINITDIPQ